MWLYLLLTRRCSEEYERHQTRHFIFRSTRVPSRSQPAYIWYIRAQFWATYTLPMGSTKHPLVPRCLRTRCDPIPFPKCSVNLLQITALPEHLRLSPPFDRDMTFVKNFPALWTKTLIVYVSFIGRLPIEKS